MSKILVDLSEVEEFKQSRYTQPLKANGWYRAAMFHNDTGITNSDKKSEFVQIGFELTDTEYESYPYNCYMKLTSAGGNTPEASKFGEAKLRKALRVLGVPEEAFKKRIEVELNDLHGTIVYVKLATRTIQGRDNPTTEIQDLMTVKEYKAEYGDGGASPLEPANIFSQTPQEQPHFDLPAPEPATPSFDPADASGGFEVVTIK